MTSIILKPWPFEDRIVKLHWFGNVRLNSEKNWRIKVAYEDQNKVVLLDYPIGLLPLLRIGRYYQEGKPLISQKEGIIDNIEVDSLKKGKVEKALDICKKFNYYLYGKAELINQKMWSFESKGFTYHIPQVELIRALYVKNKLLANAMLRPNGLEYMLFKQYIFKYNARLDFSNEVPKSLMSNDFVQHFAWIYTNKDIKNSFESIQTNVYISALSSSFSYGQSLEFIVPNLLNSQWTYRGINYGTEILILELMGFSGAELHLKKIRYSHPSIKKRIYTNKPKKKLASSKKTDRNYEIDINSKNTPKENTNQSIVEQEATQIMFNENPIIKSIAKYKQTINQNDEYIHRNGPGGVITVTAGIDESIIGGNIQPIDFKTFEIIKDINGYGLDDFIEMIRKLKRMHPTLTISMSLVNIPSGRKFSLLPDGRIRTCLIAKINRLGTMPKYILEVAKPDNISLSTLILSSKNNKIEEDEITINLILKLLVLNGGHWDKKALKHINYVLLKHTDNDARHWASRILITVNN